MELGTLLPLGDIGGVAGGVEELCAGRRGCRL